MTDQLSSERRPTRQRAAIEQALTGSAEFRSAQEIHAALAGSGTRVGLATVYRNLQAMATEGESHLDSIAVASAVAAPVFVLLLAFFALYSILIGAFDPFHVLLFGGALAILGISLAVAAAGAPLSVWLSLVVLAPVVIIVGYETIGYRHQQARLAEIRLG